MLSATRLLRRISLSFLGRPPSTADYEPLLAAASDAEREAILDKTIDAILESPEFYRTMVEFGREWMALPAIPATADEPEYVASQQINLGPCPMGTTHEGVFAMYNIYAPGMAPCSGLEADGTPVSPKTVEPWWAPGTTVQVIGQAANDASVMMKDGKPVDCGAGLTSSGEAGCGCGKNLVYCHPADGPGYANWKIYLMGNPDAQRRLLWEEPARLIAHIAWHDKPLSDIVTGSYSVGPVEVQVAYVRAGRRTGATQLDDDQSWWRPEAFTTPVDPDHDSTDPKAWREFEVPSRNPYLLAQRDYHFDPRTEPPGSMKGIPAAGALTTIGMLGAFPRERVRAARMLETFACETFIPPPADQSFNAYERDPAAEGPCQHCHTRIDPAAIHFKRFGKMGDVGGAYVIPGVGNWTFPAGWATGEYPYNNDPFAHWNRWWQPDSRMTPVTEAEAMANPEARFIDFLPPDQALLGAVSDGTVGPLGFGKLIVAAGAFDRCAVLKLHERFAGRAIVETEEKGYRDLLISEFVTGGRTVRAFLKALTKTEVFRRGL